MFGLFKGNVINHGRRGKFGDDCLRRGNVIPPGVVVIVVVVVVVVVVDNFRLKFLFINLSQVKVSVHKFKLGKFCSNSEAF